MNHHRLENLSTSVSTLREYVNEPITSKRDLAGTVFGFILTFELAWKCLQDAVGDLGYLERGPKPVLQAALQSGLIQYSDEPTWSQMLEDRNLASHVYREELALEIFNRVRATHLAALEVIAERLQHN
jgi:nucleotidyltransferase substrate binding protein (TIGR01987 family)